MSRIGLGFDTGGTYTDAVIMDMDSGEIFARSKSLTTRKDLSIGIRGAIKNFDKDILSKVSTVCLSSTLATNSIVEGRGCRVGLICMGSELTISTNIDESIVIEGSHNPLGKETEPLDEESARMFLKSIKGKVDSVAITGFMSVRNPEHEQKVKEMAKEILGVPAVCGYELSSGLGFNERAITCVLNARLIPVIQELIASVERVLSEVGIADAPLMIVKGDGSVMSKEMAMERPVETILSGPASSINGAKRLANINDAVVCDIGGTTTDIGVVRNGKPRLDPEGAFIGGYRTRVMAAEITTAGMGGDSRIILNGQRLYLGTARVTPLCVASTQYPAIKERLQKISKLSVTKTKEAKYENNIVMDTEFFIKMKEPTGINLSDIDLKFLDYVSEVPRSLAEAKMALKELPISFNIPKMEELGIVQRIGLTPTDIMHARGTFTMYDTEASKLGIKILAAKLDMTPKQFINQVDEMITHKISMEIIKKVIYEDSGVTELDGFGLDLLEKSISNTPGTDYVSKITLNKPIIGMGGPTYDMLPHVAERLGTTLINPSNYDVGNAIGAVTGNVEESIEMLIQPAAGSRLSDPACTVFSRLGRYYRESFHEGIEFAIKTGSEYVTEQAIKAGAENIKIDVEQNQSGATVGVDAHRVNISETTIVIKATGTPKGRKVAQ